MGVTSADLSTDPAAVDDPTAEPDSGRGGLGTRLLNIALGPTRVVLVLAFLWIVFTLAESRFLTASNLTNLALQNAAVGMISVGVVLVLLIGEIDLSIGAVSGLCAAIMAVLTVQHGWSPYLGLVAGILAGTGIGLLHGVLSTLLRVPSFIITLAGLLAWQGALLQVLGKTGTVNINDDAITSLARNFLPDWLSWTLGVMAIVVLAGSEALRQHNRAKAGLETRSRSALVIRVVFSTAAVAVALAVLNSDRGVPVSVVILLAVVTIIHLLLTTTVWGRHVYAVGGNAEASKRMGMRVTPIRIGVFMLTASLAAAGGMLAAARLSAVSSSSGGSDLLLLAIAGPVIAGVSLFGGRGTVWAAPLGALIIGSISNGMDLLSLSAAVKFMVTGAVLLVAVALDALAQRRDPVLSK